MNKNSRRNIIQCVIIVLLCTMQCLLITGCTSSEEFTRDNNHYQDLQVDGKYAVYADAEKSYFKQNHLFLVDASGEVTEETPPEEIPDNASLYASGFKYSDKELLNQLITDRGTTKKTLNITGDLEKNVNKTISQNGIKNLTVYIYQSGEDDIGIINSYTKNIGRSGMILPAGAIDKSYYFVYSPSEKKITETKEIDKLCVVAFNRGYCLGIRNGKYYSHNMATGEEKYLFDDQAPKSADSNYAWVRFNDQYCTFYFYNQEFLSKTSIIYVASMDGSFAKNVLTEKYK